MDTGGDQRLGLSLETFWDQRSDVGARRVRATTCRTRTAAATGLQDYLQDSRKERNEPCLASARHTHQTKKRPWRLAARSRMPSVLLLVPLLRRPACKNPPAPCPTCHEFARAVGQDLCRSGRGTPLGPPRAWTFGFGAGLLRLASRALPCSDQSFVCGRWQLARHRQRRSTGSRTECSCTPVTPKLLSKPKYGVSMSVPCRYLVEHEVLHAPGIHGTENPVGRGLLEP